MSLYYRGAEIRAIDDALYAEWVAAENPKAGNWALLPHPPEHNPSTQVVKWTGAQWVVEETPITVPDSAPAHHFIRALRAAGVRNEVVTYVNQLPDDDPIKDMWLRAPYFYRSSPEIESIRVGMGYTRKRIDNVFILAGKMQQ